MPIRSRNALLVDDDALVRGVLADMLAELGFQVTEAGTPDDALSMVGRLRGLDLLITDILMPGMDGWTLAEQVRVTHPDLPIMYITGYSADADRPVERARVVRKPFTQRSLVDALTDLLL